MKKVIELWKTNCEHCEAVKSTVEGLEKLGYDAGFIYTPMFINPC